MVNIYYQVKASHSSLDTANLTISTGLVIPKILEYYSNENSQSDNLNSLLVYISGKSNLVLAGGKVGSFT